MKQPSHYRQNSAERHDSRDQNTPSLLRVSPHFSPNLSPTSVTQEEGRGRGNFCKIALVFLLLLSPLKQAFANSLTPTSQPSPEGARVSWLLGQLRSDDAATRQSAAALLTRMGTSARPAILKLIKSADPGLAQQAAQILLDLPWYTSEDPPAVREILQRNFGSPDVEIRRDTIRQLATLPDGQGFPALSRIVNEDPSPAVQWTIVTCLRVEEGLDSFRTATPVPDSSRSLALCGYAQLSTNLPAAVDDLRQAAELELASPTDDDGEFDMIIRLLAQAACDQKNYEQAADWRRKELDRGSDADQEGIPTALLELFALHADFGPLKGFEGDMRLAGDDMQKPKIQYALAQMYHRNNDPVHAQVAQEAAFAASTNRIQHYDVGEFLYDHGWDTFAETELNAFLKNDAADPVNGGADMSPSEANVLFRLSELAVKRGDDLTAAHDKERAMQLLPDQSSLDMVDNDGHRWKVPASTIWAQVYWRYLRAAVAHHDDKEIDRRIEQIMHLRPDDADIAIDAVPILQQRGRKIDADLLFKWAYDPMKQKLDADPENPENLNGLAWLCAKCDRHLPEALTWSQKAASLMPDNAAILDTLAEVNYHLGHYTEALKDETRASTLEPDDDFMKQQLDRFKAAANNPTTRPN
jgi:tetratricopeptide (TPR) repeat protein